MQRHGERERERGRETCVGVCIHTWAYTYTYIYIIQTEGEMYTRLLYILIADCLLCKDQSVHQVLDRQGLPSSSFCAQSRDRPVAD